LPKKATLDKGDCIIFNSFCTSKEIVIRIKKHPKESEKILTSYSMNEGLISRIYQELKELGCKRTKKSNK
jgi:hypothetical protein